MKSVFLIACTLALFAAPQKKDDPELQLQSAIQTENVDGDLKSAIEQYRKVIDRRGTSRDVVAKALVRLGLCYEKQGNAEARKQFERVVREYGDQKEAVATARARIAASAKPSHDSGVVARQIWVGPKVQPYGSISPDGRYISYSEGGAGDLAVHEIATGTDRRLTTTSTRAGDYAENSVISRDGRQVAYAWFNLNEGRRYELRLANLVGDPNPRRLFANGDINWVAPHDWSPDGKLIAVMLMRKDRSAQIGLVAAGDGSLRVLKSVDWRGATNMSFSPDGNYLAFDLPTQEASPKHDVYVLAVNGSRETPAVVHPSDDVLLGWSPDGKHLLFGSDRTGSMGLWAQGIVSGTLQGAARLVKPDIGRPQSLGVTASGAIYFGITTSSPDVQIATFNFNTGEFLSPPVNPIQEYVGTNSHPDWSRDGKYLSYVSRRDVLAIRTLATGEVRVLRPNMAGITQPRWALDGRSLLVSGTDLKGRRGIYRVDAQSGEVSPIVTAGIIHQQSRDGKKLYYNKGGVFVERDLASGEEREAIRTRVGMGIPNLSPDSRYAAARVQDPSTKAFTIMLFPIAGGGEPRELFRVPAPKRAENFLLWTPDSSGVIVGTFIDGKEDQIEFWRLSLDGAQPRPLGNALNARNPGGPPIRVHPDGRQIAFVGGRRANEVWALENFLPALNVGN
ncbi:MAG: PD40 domain-containing protein [Acidobacteria bacterium]|nr:PD40 domain-containing protein [Acidobacteriota bacterium]